MYMHLLVGNCNNLPLVMKLSGDGAPFHRSTSYILLSFSFPILDDASLSANGMFSYDETK